MRDRGDHRLKEQAPDSSLVPYSPVFAGLTYPLWHLVAPASATDPWLVWWLVGAYAFAVGMLSPRVALLRRHHQILFYGIMWLVVGHFFALAALNGMHPFYSVGSVIGVLASAIAIESRRALLAFSSYVMLLALTFFASAPDVLKTAYWVPCLVLLASSYTRLSRQLDAEEEVARSRELLEQRVEMRTRELSRRTEELARTNQQLQVEMAERERLEDRLRLAQKLEALGRLAGGVAHDFNNILTAISGHAELIQRRLPQESGLRDDAEQIGRSVERAAAITRQLVSFSRRRPEPDAIVDVNAVLADALPMLRVLMGEDVDTRLMLDDRPHPIRANRDRIEQVVLNLAVNARDAMPRGGTFSIETLDARREFPEASIPPDVVGERILLLRVTDTGHGMDRETAARAFDPFFTTKDVDGGSGLGLSIVYGIVQQTGGHVQIHSEPERGTRLEVFWPAVEDVRAQAEELPRSTPPHRGHERILLVEDEDELRQLVQRVLEGSGYAVLEARDGEAALQLAAREREPIDLLLTDVVMPRMSGIQLAERLADLRPQMKVLFISGHPDHPTLRGRQLPAGSVLMAKPFPPSELSQRVRECLDLDAPAASAPA